MPIDTTRFSRDRQRFLAQLERGLAAEVTQVAKAAHRELFEGNPVKTGRSSASWNLTRNQPDTSFWDENYQNPGPSRFQDTKRRIEGFKVGDTLWISNHVPYIEDLENGNSQQAPNGWIIVAIAGLEGELRRLGAIA
jgi:hypothetical protein